MRRLAAGARQTMLDQPREALALEHRLGSDYADLLHLIRRRRRQPAVRQVDLRAGRRRARPGRR